MTTSRLVQRLDELALVGADPAGGVSRLAFTAADVAGRELVAGWMTEAGLDVHVDAATNLIGRRDGTAAGAPAIVLGSHLDTVRRGGHLDGAYGVVAAVEVAATLGPLQHPLAVVAFANEEGTVDPPGFTGSRAIVAQPVDLGSAAGDFGDLADAVAGAGGDPAAIASAAWPAGSVAAFVELHIEQGPVLDAAGGSVAVVAAIVGRAVLDVMFTGAANHAGTTPMALRHDALTAAAELVVAVERLAVDGVVGVATTGWIAAIPNVRNVVPGAATIGVDVHDADDGRVEDAVVAIREAATAIAARRGLDVTIDEHNRMAAVPADPAVRSVLEHVVAARGLDVVTLPSGAGHDAQVMASIAPMGMLFVTSRDGVSHSPLEWTEPEHLDLGAALLADAVAELDRTLATSTGGRP